MDINWWWKKLRSIPFILKRSVMEFVKDNCPARAAGLAFTTLLSIIPIFVVSFSIYSSFGAFEDHLDNVRDFLFRYVNPAAISEVDSAGEGQGKEETTQALDTLYQQILASSEKATTVGVLGLLALILSAWALLNSVEKSMNHIWSVRSQRNLIRRFMAYTAFIFWFPILIAISSYLTAVLGGYFMESPLMGGMPGLKSWAIVVPFAFTWGAFFFAFTAIPNTSVPWKATLIGSFVAGLLWELAKVGFDYYIGQVSSFKMIYGALGTIPLFLLWVYYSWLIVLYGAELSYCIARPLRFQPGKQSKEGHAPFHALNLLVEVARRYLNGQPAVTGSELQDLTDLPEPRLEDLIHRLVKNNLLVESADDPRHYVPASAPDHLKVADILIAAEGQTFLIPEGGKQKAAPGVEKTLKEARLEREAALKDKTLADVMQEEDSSQS